ncbi:MAG: hypothetical protein RL653_1643 [Pseudomonadota bacterium]
MRAAVVLFAVAWLTGCTAARVQLREPEPVHNAAGRFALASAPGDEQGTALVREALARAAPRLAAWGGLRETVNVWVMPSHAALEEAVNRKGYDWLRAWARYSDVYVQSPSTWGMFGAYEEDVAELMLHELTHCVMYQAAATRTGWSRKGIPLWFREGMASWTARQAARWMTLESLAAELDRDPGKDPLRNPEPLYQSHSELVYAAAHHAFTFLVRERGEDTVRAVLAKMGQGDGFAAAFEHAVGVPESAFVEDFRGYLRDRRFRSAPHRPVAPAQLRP